MNIGFLGAGGIAYTVADTLSKMPSIKLYAVSARQMDRAKAFADAFGFSKAYGNYEDMLADPNVDLVYISTINSLHAKHMQMCIEAGKAVLCEKPFTSTAEEARDVLMNAARNRVFVGEAIWPRYVPMAGFIKELVDSARLGKIVSLQANLGYPVCDVPRINKLELSGGALLDIGIYPLTFASLCFGDDVKLFNSMVQMSPSGVDWQSMVELVYEDERRAFLYSTTLTATDRRGVIYGSEGYAVVHNVNNYQGIDIYDVHNKLVEQIRAPRQISGYEYQFEAAMNAVKQGIIECKEMPHKLILRMMELMDSIRHSWGMYYPCEQEAKRKLS